jgi:hypothetical protein
MSRRKEPSIPDLVLDQLLGGTDASAAFEQGGILADPDRIAALRARLEKALGREPSAAPEADRGRRNQRSTASSYTGVVYAERGNEQAAQGP